MVISDLEVGCFPSVVAWFNSTFTTRRLLAPVLDTTGAQKTNRQKTSSSIMKQSVCTGTSKQEAHPLRLLISLAVSFLLEDSRHVACMCLVLSISGRMRWESRKCDALLMEDGAVPRQHFAAGRILAPGGSARPSGSQGARQL